MAKEEIQAVECGFTVFTAKEAKLVSITLLGFIRLHYILLWTLMVSSRYRITK